MYCSKLSTIGKTIYIVVFFLFVFPIKGEELSVNEFSCLLKQDIAKGKPKYVQRYDCSPISCLGMDEYEFIFGNGTENSYVSLLMKKPSTKIKTFGPYKDEGGDDTIETYSIVFYDPEIVAFDKNGLLSELDRERFWWKGYVETIVQKNKNGWSFHRTPFYYGAHLPWAEDY